MHSLWVPPPIRFSWRNSNSLFPKRVLYVGPLFHYQFNLPFSLILVASISPKIKWGLPPPTFPMFTCQNVFQHPIAKIETHRIPCSPSAYSVDSLFHYQSNFSFSLILVASISSKIKWGFPPLTFPKFTCQNIFQLPIAKIEIHPSKINSTPDCKNRNSS